MINSFPILPNSSKFGSVLKFFFIDVNDVLEEPEIFENKVMGNYTFKAGKNLLIGYFDKDTAKLDFTDSSDNKGKLIKNNFSGTIYQSDIELTNLFCEMRNRRYIVFIADFNKKVRVIGRLNAGAIFSFNFSTNKKIEDSPNLDFKFTYESACCVPVTTQIIDLC